MAPKPSAEKKPAQPAKKAVAKKSTGGKKKGSKKAVESYKIYIYKVCTLQRTDRLAVIPICFLCATKPTVVSDRVLHFSGLEAGSPRHRDLIQSNVNLELVHC